MKILKFSKAEIHIWSYSIIPEPSKVEINRSYLCQEEFERACLFYNDDLKHKYILARGGLKDILTQYTAANHPLDLKFKYLKYGKPILEPTQNPQSLFFNLSHSNETASVVLSNISPVGIDIEYIKPINNIRDLAKSSFSTSEYEEMICQNKKMELLNFYRIWTRKEAIVKSLGVGLNCPFNQFAVSGLEDENPILKFINWKGENKEDWHIGNINVDENYIGAYALKTSLPVFTKTYKLSTPINRM